MRGRIAARAFALALVALAAPACNAILGEYTVSGGGKACTLDTEKEDCDADEGCDALIDDGVCRLVCSDSNPCPEYRKCSGRFCSDPVGTECAGAEDCGNGGQCITLDEDGKKLTHPYCSISCDTTEPAPCPDGYTCGGSFCGK